MELLHRAEDLKHGAIVFGRRLRNIDDAAMMATLVRLEALPTLVSFTTNWFEYEGRSGAPTCTVRPIFHRNYAASEPSTLV